MPARTWTRLTLVAAALGLCLAGPAMAKGKRKFKAAPAAPVVQAPIAHAPHAASSVATDLSPALRHFAQIDTSGDGLLSREEILAFDTLVRERIRGEVSARLRAADLDGDGRLSRAEALANLPALSEHFDMLDVDADGYVGADDLAVLAARHEHRERLLALFRRADVDGNGKLDLAEAQVGLPSVALAFARLDADSDGYLTLVELATAAAALRF